MLNYENFVGESSYDTVKSIMATLKSNFAEFDKKVEDGSVEWFKKRAEELKQFKADNRELARKDQWAYYDKLWAIAQGKGNYSLLQYGWSNDVEKRIRKSEQDNAAKRNFKISNSLEKLGITEVISSKINHSQNGFNGYFEVETDKGTKRIAIDTIFAGGYNIQRAHFRVLVKVK